MSDKLEVLFQWPHPEPKDVILTGTFDKWSKSYHLKKGPNGFEGSILIPWNEKVAYKFIVDGTWYFLEDKPTEPDHDGNINNIYITPPKPLQATPQVGDVKPTPNVDPPPVKKLEIDGGQPASNGVVPTADIKPEGTSSALGYVASGFGGVINTVIGVDPINAAQIAIPPPKPNDQSDAPKGQPAAPKTLTPVPDQTPETPSVKESVVSPTLPVVIVPVNASQNNTSGKPAAIIPKENPESEFSTHGPSIAVGTIGKQTRTDQPVAVADDNIPGSAPVEPVSQIIATPSASDLPVKHDLSPPSLPSPHDEIIDKSAASPTSEVSSGTGREPMQASQETVMVAPVVVPPTVPSPDAIVPPDVSVVAEKPLTSVNGHAPSTEPPTSPELSEKKPAGVIVEIPKDSMATANLDSREPSRPVETVSGLQSEAKQLSQDDSSVLDSTRTVVTESSPPPYALPIESSVVPAAPSGEPVKQLEEKRPTASTDGGVDTVSVVTEPRKESVEDAPKTGHEAAKPTTVAAPLEPIQQRVSSLRSRIRRSPSPSKPSTVGTRKYKTICERIKSIFFR